MSVSRYIFRVVFGFLLLCSTSLCAQAPDLSERLIGEDAKREEIQRYFGYEDLLYRYVTLPYDVSSNVNQQGRHVDIGFVLFAFIPLILLYFVYSKKKWFYGCLILMILYLSICFCHSFLFDQKNTIYNPVGNKYAISTESIRWEGFLLEPVYNFAGVISAPILNVLDRTTGAQDHITYPFLSILFLGFIFLLTKNKRWSKQSKTLAIIGFSYAFLWLMLSGGIIWYGFLMIPLGYTFIMMSLSYKDKSGTNVLFILKPLLFLVAGAWMFMSYTSRISNISATMNLAHPDLGKLIVESRIIPYSVGMVSERDCIDYSATNVSLALDQINADSSLIYQVGTSLAFEIKQNHIRIFEDNNLSFFYNLAFQFKTKQSMTARLKAYGFKYILIDLLLPTLDRTPEQSLREKYRIFLGQVVANNPQMQLIATDRVIMVPHSDGQSMPIMGVFGEDISNFGTYAIYKIL